MAAWSWKLFMCHTISDYMEQHDVGPLLRSVCIADSYIRGHFTLFHTGDGYFTFWERNHPGHYTQELGTDCISTAISLIISSLHQWEASVFFLFCALYEQEVSEINIKMVSQSRTPLTPSPSTTSIISEALGVSRKSEVIWHIIRFPGWFPALELACHCDLILT